MSVRGDILDALQASLATITKANLYESDVVEVRRDRTYEGSFADTSPRLTIIDIGPDLVRQRCAGTKVRSVMAVDVLAFVMGQGRERPPTDELDSIIRDVRKLAATFSLGANVREATLVGIPERFIAERIGVVRFTIEVNYLWDEANP